MSDAAVRFLHIWHSVCKLGVVSSSSCILKLGPWVRLSSILQMVGQLED